MIGSIPQHALIGFGLRQAWHSRAILPVQIITYSILIYVFSAVFRITPFGEVTKVIALNDSVMIWYMVFTEMVIFAGGTHNFHDVRNDVMSGLFSSSLQRPKSYLHMKLWVWVGENLGRCAVFLVVGWVLGMALSSEIPYRLVQIPFLVASLYVSTLIYGIIYFMLGVLEVWGPYSRPIMWMTQKFIFVLGGIILPLQLYPVWLQYVAWCTPFPAMLYLPASLALGPSFNAMIWHLVVQLCWLFIMMLIAFWVQSRAQRVILRSGQM